MSNDLRGILPQRVINQYMETRAHSVRDAAKNQDPREAAQENGVELHWCGKNEANLVIELDGHTLADRWQPQGEKMIRIPTASGSHQLRVSTAGGEHVNHHDLSIGEREWKVLDIGHIYDRVVLEPNGSSQFSFEDGRSACSFLCCAAAITLQEKLKSKDGEISCADIVEEDVAMVLSRGMRMFSEEGKVFIEAAGLEHTSVGEVLMLCDSVLGGRIKVAEDGSFWGILTEESSLHDALQQAVALAKQQSAGKAQPIIVAITRPPETLLIVIREDAKLFGVLDTHTRFVGSVQHPAGWYACANLQALTEMLCATFLPLPAGLAPEELGTYAMFELTLLDLAEGGQPAVLSVPGAADTSGELDPDAEKL